MCQYTHGVEVLSLLHIWQIGVLGHNSTQLAHHLVESQQLYTLTKPKKLLVTF